MEETQSVYRRRDLGELVIVLSNGLAPVKREHGVTTIAPGSGQLVRVAVPYYMVRGDDLAGVSLSAKNRDTGGEVLASAELVQDIDNIALKTLDAEMPAILARSAARAVAKYQVTRELSRQETALGILSNVLNVVTERADTRSWLTLPKTMYLARVALEPGMYDIDLEFTSGPGALPGRQTFEGVDIVAGRTRYLSRHRVTDVALR